MSGLGQAEITVAAVTECAADWRWDSKGSPWRHLILWLVTEGCGTMRYGGRDFPVLAGDCYVFRMWHRCIGEHDPKTPLTVHWCEFQYCDDAGHPFILSDDDDQRLPAIHRRPPDLLFLTQIFDRAIQYSRVPGRKVDADLWMNATLNELARQDALLPRCGLDLEHFEAVRGVVSVIRQDLGRAWTVCEMARRMHYSPDHFTRVFRSVMGQSPREFLVQARIDEARNLLSMSSYSIGRIADLLGYSDIYHFSNQFKARTGVAPSRFRSRN